MRKVIQLCGFTVQVGEEPTTDSMLFALCDDGSMWGRGWDGMHWADWHRVKDLPKDSDPEALANT